MCNSVRELARQIRQTVPNVALVFVYLVSLVVSYWLGIACRYAMRYL